MTDYYGILEDGTNIYSIDLKDIKDAPGVKYLFRRVLQQTIVYWQGYKYVAIDKKDKQRSIRIGDFELVDIGPEILGGSSYIRRSLTIKELRTNLNRTKDSTTGEIAFVTEDLLPLLNKLNELGSWEMYEKSFEIDKLREENISLQNEVDQLKKQLEEAQNKTKKRKS